MYGRYLDTVKSFLTLYKLCPWQPLCDTVQEFVELLYLSDTFSLSTVFIGGLVDYVSDYIKQISL